MYLKESDLHGRGVVNVGPTCSFSITVVIFLSGPPTTQLVADIEASLYEGRLAKNSVHVQHTL